VLYRRRGEDPQAVARLSPDQYADLHNRKTARSNRVAAAQAAETNTGERSPVLFTVTGGGA
jgi:hypothetical protein